MDSIRLCFDICKLIYFTQGIEFALSWGKASTKAGKSGQADRLGGEGGLLYKAFNENQNHHWNWQLCLVYLDPHNLDHLRSNQYDVWTKMSGPIWLCRMDMGDIWTKGRHWSKCIISQKGGAIVSWHSECCIKYNSDTLSGFCTCEYIYTVLEHTDGQFLVFSGWAMSMPDSFRFCWTNIHPCAMYYSQSKQLQVQGG